MSSRRVVRISSRLALAAASAKPWQHQGHGLIKEAEAACKAGDMNTAKAKAEAAIAELK